MKLDGDSSLHFVSLRMTDNCVFGDGVVGSRAANYPILSKTSQILVILSEAKNLLLIIGQ